MPLIVGSVRPIIPDFESDVGSGVWRISRSPFSVADGDEVDTTPSPWVTSVSVSLSSVGGEVEGFVGTGFGVGEVFLVAVATTSVVSVVEGLYGRCVLVLVGCTLSVSAVVGLVGWEGAVSDGVMARTVGCTFGLRMGEGAEGGLVGVEEGTMEDSVKAQERRRS